VKFGALAFILFLPQQYAIQLQLLGGVWMIQTFPAIIVACTRAGSIIAACCSAGSRASSGTGMAASLASRARRFPLELFGHTISGYAAFYALLLNFTVAIAVTLIARALKWQASPDATSESDYDDSDKEDMPIVPDLNAVPAVD